MNYYIWRNNQQYGPYSLADLQRYLGSGDILPTDMGRGENSQQWVQVQQLVGMTPVVSPPPAQTVYKPAPPQTVRQAAAATVVPDLHWAILLILGIVTCGLFMWVWLFIQAAAVRRLDAKSNALLFYAIGLALSFGGGILRGGFMYGHPGGGGALLSLAAIVIVIIGHFNIRNSLEYYFTQVEPLGLTLNGVMTFFFGPIYFQYHFNRINRWRRTGVFA